MYSNTENIEMGVINPNNKYKINTLSIYDILLIELPGSLHLASRQNQAD